MAFSITHRRKKISAISVILTISFKCYVIVSTDKVLYVLMMKTFGQGYLLKSSSYTIHGTNRKHGNITQIASRNK